MLEIRPAKESDIDRIVEMAMEFERYLIDLDNTLMSEMPPAKVYRKYLLAAMKERTHAMFIAEMDGHPVGFTDLRVYPEFMHGGLSAYLHNLFVREEYRGKGIGDALLKRTMEEAKKRGAVAYHISVKKKNIGAIEFYKKRGIDEELVMLETRLD